MNTQTALPRLGDKILILMDRTPGFIDALRDITFLLPGIEQAHFTLLCCCPTRYWEHGGISSDDTRQEVDVMWSIEEAEFSQADHCISEVEAILQAVGVPLSHVAAKTATEDSIISATMLELRHGLHTGIILSHYHRDIVNRLRRKGVTDAFRQIPKVEVLEINLPA